MAGGPGLWFSYLSPHRGCPILHALGSCEGWDSILCPRQDCGSRDTYQGALRPLAGNDDTATVMTMKRRRRDDRLAVESQEVVPIKTRAADRWSMVKATMRAVPVVVVKPGKKMVMALLGVLIGPGISPFAESGLDETFGFAVGARGIGTSEVVAQTQFNNGSVESVGAITVAVIGEQAADGNAQAGVIGDCGAQKGDGGNSGEVGQDLGESNAGMVIDGDMDVFPATVVLTPAAAVGTKNHAGEASQLLNIEVKQIARSSMLIANQRHSRFQIAHAVQTQAAKNATDGSATQTRGLGNIKTGETLAPQLFDALRQRLPGATWRTMRTGGAIVQTSRTFLLITAGPLGGGAGADIEGGGRSLQSHSLKKDVLC